MKLLTIIFGIIVFGCAWTPQTEKELHLPQNGCTADAEKLKIKVNSQKMDSTLIFDQLEIGKRTLYTGGGGMKNGDTKTNGIYIKKISDSEIEYSYSQLINWKKEFEKNGVANLISISDSILTIKGLKESAYKFMDSENDIVIFVTKNERINITKSKVYNKAGQQISELMYNK